MIFSHCSHFFQIAERRGIKRPIDISVEECAPSKRPVFVDLTHDEPAKHLTTSTFTAACAYLLTSDEVRITAICFNQGPFCTCNTDRFGILKAA